MGDLTSAAAVKSYLGIQGSQDDSLLATLVTQCSAWIESFLNRTFASQAFNETRNGSGGQSLVLRNAPVIQPPALMLQVDGSIVPQSTAPGVDGWVLDNGQPSTATLWLRGSTYRFTRDVQNVVIQYTAGYATPPADIELAAIQLVAWRYRERDRIGQASKTVNGQEVVSFQVKDVPEDVKTLLSNWRQVAPL